MAHALSRLHKKSRQLCKAYRQHVLSKLWYSCGTCKQAAAAICHRAACQVFATCNMTCANFKLHWSHALRIDSSRDFKAHRSRA